MSSKQKGLFKAVPRINDMEKDMYREIEKIAKDSVELSKEKYKDRDLCWHVIVGRNFGGCITYKEKVMTYFYVGQIGFLVFATPDV